jgi:hypothetical protein
MARKTRDEWQIHGLYTGGWEEVTAEDTRKEALARLKEYRENERGTSFKLVHKRVPIGPSTGELNTVSDIRDTTARIKRERATGRSFVDHADEIRHTHRTSRKTAARSQYVTGDHKRWPSMEAAIEHANEVHRRTGNIISVEKLTPERRTMLAQAKRQLRGKSNSIVAAEQLGLTVRDYDLSDISDAKLQALINSTAPGPMRETYLHEAGKRVAAQVESENRDAKAARLKRGREDRVIADQPPRALKLGSRMRTVDLRPKFKPPFHVDVWQERDRTSIVLFDADDVVVAEWWDDDAQQMFEDGFFVSNKGARRLEQSVIEYAREMGIIPK